jgi:hypothetical protein
VRVATSIRQRTEVPARPRFRAALKSLSQPDAAVILILFAAVWLLTRPYYGIVHDARLYTVQALEHLHPGRYADDLYFKYGSQDSFSVFGPLLAQVIRWVTPTAANAALVRMGELLWLGAAISFLSAIYKTNKFLALALAGLIILPAGYGGDNVFNYAEPFLTPRIFAEALVMFGIGAALRDHWTLCCVLCVAALAVHPLMAAPGILFIFSLLAAKDRRWWLVSAAGLLLVAFAAVAGIEPFARLRFTFTGEWLTIVLQRCRFSFLAGWWIWDYLRLLSQALIVAIALPLVTAVERRLLHALGATVAIGLLATAIGGDLLNNVLLVNGQPWRVLWIASVFVNQLAAVTLWRLHLIRSPSRWYFAAALVVYLLSGMTVSQLAPAAELITPAAALFLVALLLELAKLHGWDARRLVIYPAFVVAVVSGLAAAVLTAIYVIYAVRVPHFSWLILDLGVLALASSSLFALFLRKRKIALGIALVVLIASIGVSDRRDEWDRFVSEPGVKTAELAALIGSAKNVYWEDETNNLLWFNLQRPNYYSCLQGTGAMFYEKTALDYQRRTLAFAPLNIVEFVTAHNKTCYPKTVQNAFGPKKLSDVASVCRSLSDLDLLILMTKVDDWDPPSWEAPAAQYALSEKQSRKPVKTYYFYKCDALRERGGTGK